MKIAQQEPNNFIFECIFHLSLSSGLLRFVQLSARVNSKKSNEPLPSSSNTLQSRLVMRVDEANTLYTNIFVYWL